jgi:hypothetical protein
MELGHSILNPQLAGALIDAINETNHAFEERGGVLLEKYGDYRFQLLSNLHADTSRAYGLYEADRNEFGQLVIPEMQSGWTLFASFHTHPKFSANPSSLDLEKLFQGFKCNVIYSPLNQECSISEWLEIKKEEYGLKTKYIGLETLLNLSK